VEGKLNKSMIEEKHFLSSEWVQSLKVHLNSASFCLS
jgi:hypothetical protein